MRQIEITMNNSEIQWFKNKGYEIPTEIVQLFCKNKQGKQIKNGVAEKIRVGTKLVVDIDDLPPSSNRKIDWKCSNCGEQQNTSYYAYLGKKTDLCRRCFNTTQRKLDSHDYWVGQLIRDDLNAKCHISGETDKRFLVLHHLLSKSNGGKNEESNYVVLTANWHTAFHRWMGGFNIPCCPDDFKRFIKELGWCGIARPTS